MLLVGARPHLEQDSISKVARNKHRSEILREMPIYTRWFALSLCDTLQLVKDQLSRNLSELNVWFHGETYLVQVDIWKKASSCIRTAAGLKNCETDQMYSIQSYKTLRACELSFSTLVNLALDNMCFGRDFSASILHQGPMRKKQEHKEVQTLQTCWVWGWYTHNRWRHFLSLTEIEWFRHLREGVSIIWEAHFPGCQKF